MKSLLVILLGLYGSWHFIDLSSKNSMQNVIAPLFFVLFLIAFFIWLTMRTSSGSNGGSFDSGSGWDSSDFSDGGGDGGGGD